MLLVKGRILPQILRDLPSALNEEMNNETRRIYKKGLEFFKVLILYLLVDVVANLTKILAII